LVLQERIKYQWVHLTHLGRKIQILGTLRAGYSTKITCATFASCSWMPPKFTWNGLPKGIESPLQLNGTQGYSVVDFLPSVADHKQNITCRVNYTNGNNSVSRETTIQLNVTCELLNFKMCGCQISEFPNQHALKLLRLRNTNVDIIHGGAVVRVQYFKLLLLTAGCLQSGKSNPTRLKVDSAFHPSEVGKMRTQNVGGKRLTLLTA
uniref:Ig-like domain-containing protein n=1 Tax=Pseudonaja textilis TaxID=8673 RepID=A0A670ZE76_PSETE